MSQGSQGKVWLVGAGPGDPSLITVRGLRVLEAADVVLYDALSHPGLLEGCRKDADLRNVGKRGGQKNPSQEWITNQLIELAREGKRVVRLKGGDPLMFARGAEEAEALAEAGVPFEIVPGVSSPVAASAYAGISLTHRDLSSSVTFITGSDREGVEWSPEAWKKLATATDTLCVLMGMRRLEEIAVAVVQGGRDPATPVAVVQWGARPQQRVLVSNLAEVAARVREAGLSNPSVVIVGDVVRLRDRLSWFEKAPLFGRRILLLRAAEQASETAELIREHGAEPVIFPVIEFVDPPDPEPLRKALEELGNYDWVLFTSVNGVARFFAALAARGGDARSLGKARVGVIGPATRDALSRHGIHADAMAEQFIGEGLAREVLARGAHRVLLARALVARDALPDMLRERGVTVDVVPVYATEPVSADRAQALRDLVATHSVDTVLFTASSTVEATRTLLGESAAQVLAPLTIACIGPITAETARKSGIRVDVVAEEHTLPGLLQALASQRAPDASGGAG